MQKFTADYGGERLDVFIHQNMPHLSRSFATKLIDQHKVRVNGGSKKPSDKLRIDDEVEVDFDADDYKAPSLELPILYEDDDVVVIDKPIGILSHSKGAFNPEPTVATFIESKVHGMDGDRAGIVHRLDRATSGVMICAKNPQALSWLQKQFSTRKTKKTYLAVISGELDPKEAVIDMPIGRNPKAPKTFHISKQGKNAITQYKTLESKNGFSLLELKPKTGRTHQLRVHLMHLKHPIVGDKLYDGPDFERLMLHAQKLEVTLPDKKHHEFVAETPAVFHTIFDE